MLLGYNTNGLANHRWDSALDLIHETGYRSVAITVDHHCLNPDSPTLPEDLDRMRRRLDQYGMISCIETGARFLLNPRRKHEPTLVSPGENERGIRIEFLKRCIDIAGALGSQAVSFWSGILRDDSPRDQAYSRLAEGICRVIDHAALRQVRLAFEPEPGMLVETFDDFRELLDGIARIGGASETLGLCVDIGHVHCLEPRPISDYLVEWRERLVTIHIEDMVRGVHKHLPFGQGTIDFPPVIQTLAELNYQGGLNVELSQHSHLAPDVMREAFQFLKPLILDSRGAATES